MKQHLGFLIVFVCGSSFASSPAGGAIQRRAFHDSVYGERLQKPPNICQSERSPEASQKEVEVVFIAFEPPEKGSAINVPTKSILKSWPINLKKRKISLKQNMRNKCNVDKVLKLMLTQPPGI